MRRSRGEWLAWALLAATLLVPVWWGADPTFPWDSDNLAPGSVLKGLAAHFGPGWYSVYGPLPYYLMALFYLPVLVVLKLTHELGHPSGAWPFGFRHPEFSIAALVVAARLTTVACALGTAWVAAWRVREDDPETPGWLVPLLFLGSAQLGFYGRTSNVDVHALFWLFLAAALIEAPRGSLKRLCLGAAAAAAAVCCKEQSGPAAVVLGAGAAWQAWRLCGGTAARLRAVVLTGLAAVAAYALLWQLPFNLAGWKAHHEFLFADALGGRKYPATPAGFAGLAAQCASYLPLAFGFPLLAGLAAALARRVPVRGLGLRTCVVLAHAGGFIGRIGYVFPRFLLPLLLLAVPLAARGLAIRGRARAAVAVLVLLLAASGAPLVSALMLGDPRLAAERWLHARATAGRSVELAGNAHINLRPPRAATVLRVNERVLQATPRGPLADFVVLSSIDTVYMVRRPEVKAVWWDAVHDTAGAYVLAAHFPRPAVAEWLNPMWIAPGVTIYQRRPDAPPAWLPPLDPARGEWAGEAPKP